MTKSKLPLLLSAWFTANFIPHIIVYLSTGKIYYQLPHGWAIIAESSIMLLNLLLPVVVLRYLVNQKGLITESLGWQWRGWRTIGVGLIGFIIYLLIAATTQVALGNPISTPGWRIASSWEIIALLILLLGLTAASEETMFRGYLQTTLTNEYGVWIGIGVTALLFGLHHLPMDLYAGLVQHASVSAWICRMLQLYLGALLFGIVRHWGKSTWASWIIHEGVLALIIILGVATMRQH